MKKSEEMEKTAEQLATEQKWNDYIDRLIDIMDGVELGKVTILTGSNGSGKSMVRKLMNQFISKKSDKNQSNYVISTSMDDRAGVNASMGGGMVFMRDVEWEPTSVNTMHNVTGILNTKDRYVILDEIELGMGEEIQAGMCMDLNEKIKENLPNMLGVMVITHSRTIVKYLKHDAFVNLDGMTEDEWLNREVVPVSIDALNKKADELYRAFDKRLKPAKKGW